MASADCTERASVLARLCALHCTWDDAVTSTAFVNERASLLAQLAEVQAPWCEAEKKLLAQAMLQGEQCMQLLTTQQNDVAARLRALQRSQKMVAYPTAQLFSRPRRTY